MIIWSGLGILVLPVVILCVMASIILTGQFASADYVRLHNWPIGIGLLLAAAICWFLGRWLRDWRSQTLVDPQTGEPVVLRRASSLFFIPMEWWAIPLALFGMIACSMSSTPEELRQRDAEREIKRELKRQLRQPIRDQRQ